MKRSRLYTALFLCILATSSAFAQSVDWKSLGKPLSDDTTSMMDRFVYSQAETTTDKTVGVDKPILAPNEINEWIAQNIPELFALKPLDYDRKVITNQIRFTPKGYAEYISSLNAAQLPLVVKQKRFTISAVVSDPANITAKGVRDETDKTVPDAPKKLVYVWQLDVPVTLGYVGPNLNENKSYKVLLNIELVRIPMRDDATLVSINSWRLAEYKSTILTPSATTQ